MYCIHYATTDYLMTDHDLIAEARAELIRALYFIAGILTGIIIHWSLVP